MKSWHKLLLMAGTALLATGPASSNYTGWQDEPTAEDDEGDEDQADDEDEADKADEADEADDADEADEAEDQDEADDGDDQDEADTADADEDETSAAAATGDYEVAEPSPEITLLWADQPRDEYEIEAVQIDSARYLDSCAVRSECIETRDYVWGQLLSLLVDYATHSSRNRREDTPSLAKTSSITSYRVRPGQALELESKKAGPNDAELWGQVARVVPRAQSDRLISRFRVYAKPGDDTIAYVDRDTETNRYLMGINDPVHLASDVEEQKLTIVHEFMHLIVMDEAKPLDAAACKGISQDGEGCYQAGSIYADFAKAFWPKNDWESAAKGEDLYAAKKDSFVTAYAATSVHEDIADSFSFWVLNEGKGKSIADAKQRFFGQYPQLVALKQHIRTSVIGSILKERRRVVPRSAPARPTSG